MLDLGPPEIHELAAGIEDGEGRKHKRILRLRVFTLADFSWIHKRAKSKDWWIKCTSGDDELVIAIIAHQLENEAEVRGWLAGEPAEQLPRFIRASQANHSGLIVALGQLYIAAMPETRKKKRLRTAAIYLSIGLLLGLCISAAAVFHWMR